MTRALKFWMGLAAVIACFALSEGCKKESTPVIQSHSDFVVEGVGTAQVIRIRGCQYILIQGAYDGAICHAGDCDNPIHRSADNAALRDSLRECRFAAAQIDSFYRMEVYPVPIPNKAMRAKIVWTK